MIERELVSCWDEGYCEKKYAEYLKRVEDNKRKDYNNRILALNIMDLIRERGGD